MYLQSTSLRLTTTTMEETQSSSLTRRCKLHAKVLVVHLKLSTGT